MRCSTSRNNPVLFVILSGLVFFAWGEIYSLFPATCTDIYGRKFATTNYGMLYTAKGTASLLVPLANVLTDGDRQLARGVLCRGDPQHRRRGHGAGGAQADAHQDHGQGLNESERPLNNEPPAGRSRGRLFFRNRRRCALFASRLRSRLASGILYTSHE